MTTKKKRLDVLIAERGLCESREKARRLVMAGLVLVKGVPNPKPGMRLSRDAVISLRETMDKYVGRGGYKLEAALDRFDIDPAGLVCLDAGASTGGFTDCLLQRGAGKVYAVDVGYGQLHYRLRNDPRVIVAEKINARFLGREHVPEDIDLAVMDVSFISITLILPALAGLLKTDGALVSLIKPQFEAGPDKVPKGGVIKDPALHGEVLKDVLEKAGELGWFAARIMASPVRGASGNREFLALLFPSRRKTPESFFQVDLPRAVSEAFESSTLPDG